jgi:hypothetical protein
MTAYETFVERWNILTKRLREKPFLEIPDKVWEKPSRDLDKLLLVLERYYTAPTAPTRDDIKTVKQHSITSQIKAFISSDTPRKAFFKVDYFKAKCSSLPDQDLCKLLLNGKTTKDAYLTTFLAYHYWKSKCDIQSGLAAAYKQIEEDYQNNPATKASDQAKALFRSLLKEADLNKVVKVLRDDLPDNEAVKEFAKAVGLKIPSGKKPIHERLASKIITAGELVRAKL